MPVFSTIMVSILLGSVVFCFLVISRIIAYNRKYHLPELTYTRLFGVLTKEHFALLYVITIALHAIFTIWFTITI